MKGQKTVIDPVTFQLVRAALDAIGEEMALTVVRTAYSTVVKDNWDFSTALCTADGELLAQGPTIPFHLGTIPSALNSVLREFGDDLGPGDIFFLNDPYDGAIHLPDIFMFMPIFDGDKLVGFSATVVHHTDMGGRVAGSNASDSTEIYAEGIRFPALRLARRGELDQGLIKLLETNVRVPDKVMGDLRAQLAAGHIGVQGYLAVLEKFGSSTVEACIEELLAYSERLTRAAIARFPDGTYDFTDYIDNDGQDDEPIALKVSVEKRGDSLKFDFTGTSPQVRGAINAPAAFTRSTVYAVVRCLLDPITPNNGGVFRPIEVVLPPRTILSCELPAAVAARALTGFRLYDTLFGALSQMAPDQVFAAGEGGNSGVAIGGYDEHGKPFVFVEFLCNCWGGRPDRDGVEGITMPLGNMANTPIEVIEVEYPLRIEEYSLIQDSGGAGKYRGGMGARRAWRLLEKDAQLQVRSDRRRFQPYGLHGGGTGAPSANEWSPGGTDVAESLPSKFTRRMSEGDLLRHSTAGGGGWGSPLERDVELVADDVRDEKVTVDAAARLYGVVFLEDGVTVDEASTAELRTKMASV